MVYSPPCLAVSVRLMLGHSLGMREPTTTSQVTICSANEASISVPARRCRGPELASGGDRRGADTACYRAGRTASLRRGEVCLYLGRIWILNGPEVRRSIDLNAAQLGEHS